MLRSAGASLAVLLLAAVTMPLRLTAQQRPAADTVVVRATGPVHKGLGRLVPEMTIGVLDGDEKYLFGNIAELAVDKHGAVYVADYGGPTVRKYDSSGKFVREFGRGGDGPGEYRQPRGIAVSDDGHVAVASRLDRRLIIYDSTGRMVVTERLVGMYTANAGSAILSPYLVIDPLSRLWVPLELPVAGWERSARDFSRPASYLRMRLDGTPIDTVLEPIPNRFPPALYDRELGGGGFFFRPVPFTGQFWNSISPLGYFVSGFGAESAGTYGIDLHDRPAAATGRETVTSIRVPFEPVPVLSGERSAWEASLELSMRWYDPNWTWSGERLPRFKAPYQRFWIDTEGRAWIQLNGRATEDRSVRSSPEIGPGGEPDATWASKRWKAVGEFDLVEPSGRYVGRIRVDGPPMRLHAARGDHVWATTYVDGSALSITRFRIVWDD